jgi:ketosteroid isomerase-like protein
MSQENVETFKRAVDAFDRQDFEAMLEELDAAVEWYDAVPMMIGGKAVVYRGHEGVRDLWRDLDDVFEERRVEFAEVREVGNRVFASGRLYARGKGSGAEAESPYCVVCGFEKDKVIRVRTFLDPKEALEAAGLSE